MGVPLLENDVIELDLALDLDIRVATLFLTYGVTDRVDVGVVLPIVSTSLQGAEPGAGLPIRGHDGDALLRWHPEQTPNSPRMRLVQGDASGLGDVAVRVKANVRQTGRALFSLLGDARFATGSEDDLLGSGTFAVRGLAIFSAQVGELLAALQRRIPLPAERAFRTMRCSQRPASIK